MLANNNRSIINRLAKNSVKTNKRQFSILFVTILLSAFMIFSVFTIGLTYLDLSRLQNTRLYGSEYDVTIINGFTDKQKELLMNHSDVQSVGVLAYSGNIKNSDSNQNVNAALLWGDQTYWEKQKLPARTKMKGHYPKAENELLATKKVLKECGKENLSINDSFSLTYEDNTGIHTKEFIISGIWEGYGSDKANFYVSEAFYQLSGSKLVSDGVLQVKFKSNYVTTNTIENIKKNLNLSSQQVFQASDYIERSLTILLAVITLCLIICLSAYLLIYNILYLSVSGKIRYYGLLQTLGMTKKQLVQFIRKQILVVGIIAIIIGIILGISITIVFIPYIMGILNVSLGNTGLHLYPEVIVLSILVTTIAILCGIRTPIHIATDITPVEATKYRENIEITRNKKTKGKLYWRMAKDQLRKSKKRTIIVFLSLATSLIVFLCLSTIIDSQGKRTIYSNYWDADFIIYNNTQISEDITSIKSVINDDFVSKIKNTDGIKEVHTVKGIPVIFPYEEQGFSNFWITCFTEMKPYLSSSETILMYQQNPEEYYGMLKGIDYAEFDYLNETLNNVIDKQAFLNGKTAILQFSGFTIPEEWIGKSISFNIGNQRQEISIGAISYSDYYGSTVNIGANLIVSENYLKTLTKKPYILSLNIKYEQSFEEDIESEIKNIIEMSSYNQDLRFISKYDEMIMIQDSQSGMYEIGTTISLLLLFVGMLNYINTMVSSIQNRKLTLSIMESIGMSKKQINKLLIREGILYASGSIFITLTIGTGITYLIFQSMNYMKIPFSIPIIPLICAIVLMMFICIITPIITYKTIVKKRPIAERLREYE